MENNDKENKESKLSDHQRYKKELKPPFLQIGNLSLSSWIDKRLPEMLWAVLIVGNLDREKALGFFKYVALYVQDNPECYNVTITGISKFPRKNREELIERMVNWSNEVKSVLRPLALFPSLPAKDEWQTYLDKPNPEEDWQKLANGVSKTFWHQSEEATDCRWIKLLCIILGGKMKFSKQMEETVRGVIEYPNYGDPREIRPSIRALEIVLDPISKHNYGKWANIFWQYCFDNTECVPEELVSQKIKNRQKKLSEEMEKARKYYFKETIVIRNKLIDHFFKTSKTSAIDSRHEGAFGIALYGLTLFIEIIFYRIPLSITGRLSLRTLVEACITFKYLLKKEKKEKQVWDDYRSYGTGQLKLVYLKLKELNQKISSIEIENLNSLVNEDKWLEFIPIDLGHWDKTDLRKMSEEAGIKKLYDKYYNYTSGYIHANWGAVRESVYQKCVNPLHRFHRIPTYDLPLMPSVTNDAIEITNCILECLSEAYPKFDFRLKKLGNKK